MKLPLVDEIREARRLAEEAHQATMHLHRIDSALTSIDVMERQVSTRSVLRGPVPGDDVLELLQESWPQLSDLASHAPRAGEPLAQQLITRRGQLQLAKQVLRPLAADNQSRSAALHQLQHQQRHALEHPRWADEVAELADLGAERDRLALELTPLNQRLALIDPARDLLETFIGRLASEADPSADDPQGVLAWRALHLTQAFLVSLGEILHRLQLEIPLPELPDVAPRPDPDPEVRATHWAEVTRVREVLDELRGILADEGGSLRAERDQRQQRHEELTQRILERMG